MKTHFKKQKMKAGTPIPEKIRILVWERCHGRCEYCGKKAVDPHHIVYRSKGGSNEAKNLIALCRECHNSQEVKNKILKNPLKYIGIYPW